MSRAIPDLLDALKFWNQELPGSRSLYKANLKDKKKRERRANRKKK